MNREQLQAWLDAYERLWRTKGTSALREVFSEDAFYSAGPFEQPFLGLEAIAAMWEAERLGGHDEEFTMESEIVAVEGETGVVRVDIRYGEPLNIHYKDLWIVRLDPDGRCRHFEEWPFWPELDTSPPGAKEARRRA